MVSQEVEQLVLIGNREWMARNGVAVPRRVLQALARDEELGRTAVLAAINGGSRPSTVGFMGFMSRRLVGLDPRPWDSWGSCPVDWWVPTLDTGAHEVLSFFVHVGILYELLVTHFFFARP